MENKYKGIQGLDSLLSQYRNVKIVKATSLFPVEPKWEMLIKKRCPICGSLLSFPLNKTVAICKGKRHGDRKSFVIGTRKLAQILAKNGLI